MKKMKFSWGAIICIILAAVFLSGLMMRLTDGFTNFNPQDMFSRSQNEENLFFEKIEDGDLEFIVDVDATVKNGVITLNGGVPSDVTGVLTIADDPIKFADLTLGAGEYTFTAFDEPSGKEYFAVGVYTADGVTYAWLADVAKTSQHYIDALSSLGYVNVHGNTVTFDEETQVEFFIMVVEGSELKNVKAYPVVVEGAENGNFYNDSIFDK